MQEQSVDLAPFLAAIIEEGGGEISINFDTLAKIDMSDTYIAMEMNEAGTVFYLRLATESEIPEDVRRNS